MSLYSINVDDLSMWANVVHKRLTPLHAPSLKTQLLDCFAHRGETSYHFGSINDLLVKPKPKFITASTPPKVCKLNVHDEEWSLQLLLGICAQEKEHLNALQILQSSKFKLSFCIETIQEKKVYLPELNAFLGNNELRKEHPAFALIIRDNRPMEFFLIHELIECQQIRFQLDLGFNANKKYVFGLLKELPATAGLVNTSPHQIHFQINLGSFQCIAFSCIYLKVSPDGKIMPNIHWRTPINTDIQHSKDSQAIGLSLIMPEAPAALIWDQEK